MIKQSAKDYVSTLDLSVLDKIDLHNQLYILAIKLDESKDRENDLKIRIEQLSNRLTKQGLRASIIRQKDET